MRLIISPGCIALLVVCLVLFGVTVDAHAYIYLIAAAAWLTIDLGLAYANGSAVAHGDASLVWGSFGLAVGTYTAISGVAVLIEAESPPEVAISLFFTACGIASVYFGGRAISSALRQDDVEPVGRNVRLTPYMSPGDRNERQIGLVAEVSF
jgi:hypothetical protein